MSAEGKKKRGESGRVNALNIPFRYGNRGWRPPMDPYRVHPRMVNRETYFGFLGGILCAKLGYVFPQLIPRKLSEAINNKVMDRECPTITYALDCAINGRSVK